MTSFAAHHESVLCYSSTEHAKRLGPSTWKTTLSSNSLFANKSTRLSPVQVLVPNIFPNIAEDFNIVVPAGTITIPRGQYSSAEIISLFNADASAITDTLTLAQSTQGYFTLANAGAPGKTVTWTTGSVKYMGSPTTSTVIAGVSTFTFPMLPNLGGEKLVFIKCNRLASLNMYSTEGILDVVFPISLVNTNYGDMAIYTPGDHILGDVDFQSEVNVTTLEFELIDSLLQPLAFDSNQHIRMVWKLHHNEGDATSSGASR